MSRFIGLLPKFLDKNGKCKMYKWLGLSVVLIVMLIASIITSSLADSQPSTPLTEEMTMMLDIDQALREGIISERQYYQFKRLIGDKPRFIL